MATGLPGDAIVLTSPPVSNCACCGSADACVCRFEGDTYPVPEYLCATVITASNTCRFWLNPDPIPSSVTPDKQFGYDATRWLGLTLTLKRPAPITGNNCRRWGLVAGGDRLSARRLCPDLSGSSPPLEEFLVSCSASPGSGPPCGTFFETALGVVNAFYTYLFLGNHCCPPGRVPPQLGRPTLVYTPQLSAGRIGFANTVYWKYTDITCSPFAFTVGFYLTGDSQGGVADPNGGMACELPAGDPDRPPECDQLILAIRCVAGSCFGDEIGGDDGPGGDDFFADDEQRTADDAAVEADYDAAEMGGRPAMRAAAVAAPAAAVPCRFRGDDKARDGDVGAAGLNARVDWYKCERPGFRKLDTLVTECRSCGIGEARRCGGGRCLDGYEPREGDD